MRKWIGIASRRRIAPRKAVHFTGRIDNVNFAYYIRLGEYAKDRVNPAAATRPAVPRAGGPDAAGDPAAARLAGPRGSVRRGPGRARRGRCGRRALRVRAGR